jgi:DNA-binding protein HU-beta
MNKQEFIDRLAEQCDFSKAEGGRVLDAILETITETLGDRDEVALPGFGKFVTQRRRARDANDPRNPERTIRISASYVPKFRPGSNLKRVVHDSVPAQGGNASKRNAASSTATAGGADELSRSVAARSRKTSGWRPLSQR